MSPTLPLEITNVPSLHPAFVSQQQTDSWMAGDRECLVQVAHLFMVLDQELARLELVGVHGIQQLLLCCV